MRSHASGVEEGTDRILVTPLRVAGQGRQLTARDRACMRALSCAGIWTGCERYQRGYSQSPSCPRCGEPDSVLHRLWKCCDVGVVEARARVVDERVVERALAAGEESCLFTKAWVVFSEELYTQPALDPHGLRFITFDAHGHPTEHETAAEYEQHCEVGDTMFTDGSCFGACVPELARASWAVVTMAGGRVVGCVSAPVWRPLQQTAQAGEWSALHAACQLWRGEGEIIAGCAGVVDACRTSGPTHSPAGAGAKRFGAILWQCYSTARSGRYCQ